MSESTRDKLLQQFRELVGERLEKITRNLMALESAPNLESGKNALRELHGLKGEARMMGFPDINRIVHEMEELVRSAEEGNYNLTGGSTDALLAAADAVMVLSGAAPGEGAKPDVEKLVEWIKQRTTAEQNLRPNKKGKGAARDPHAITLTPASAGGGASAGASATAPARDAGSITLTGMEGGAPPRASEAASRADASGTIRISQKSLEVLTSAVTDLMQLGRRRELQMAKRLELSRELSRLAREAEELGPGAAPLVARLSRAKETAAELHRDSKLNANEELRDLSELSQEVQAIRMVPLAALFEPYPRMVRDLAKELGKEVALYLEGESTRADRSVVEALKDPLLHLVRNALDHGLETREARVAAGKSPRGRLRLLATREGERILLRVDDDGAGLNPAQLRKAAVQRGLYDEASAAAIPDNVVRDLIFVSGFSTRSSATDVSGRGLGMDVVRVRLQQLGGDVMVESAPGKGSTFTLRVPVSLTVAPLLFLEVGQEKLCLTAAHVSQALRVEPDQIKELGGRVALKVGAELLPFSSIASVLGMAPERRPNPGELVLLVNGQGGTAAISVDRVLEERVQAVLPLKGMLSHFAHLSGATPNADGSVALVLSAAHLVATARGQSTQRVAPMPARLGEKRKRRILVVDDSPLTRELLSSLLEAVGYDILNATDGVEALERLGRETVDLVVTDLEMPKMDGLELTRRLKGHPTLRSLPVIIVTTRGAEADRRHGMEAGADGYIAKGDLVRQDLVDVVTRLLS